MERTRLIIDGFPGGVFNPSSMEEIALWRWPRRGKRKQGWGLRVTAFCGRACVEREECGVEVEEQTTEEDDPREDRGR